MQKKETICRSQAINHFSMLSYRLLWWFSQGSRIKSGSVSLSGLRQRLLCIKINGAKFHGNIINHNKAFEKRTFPPPRNRLNLSEFAGKITRLRGPSRTPSWMSENRWTVFSHEFQSIIARIQAKNNENLSGFDHWIFAGTSSCKLKKTVWRLKTALLNISVIPTNGDFNQDLPHFPGF